MQNRSGTHALLILAAVAVCSSALAQQSPPAPTKPAPTKAAASKAAPKLAEPKPSLFARQAVALTALRTSFAGPNAQSCSEIMKEDLIYDQFSKMSSRNRVQQFYDWACSSNFQSSAQMNSSAVSLGIPINNIPIKLDVTGSDQSFRQSLTTWCRTAWSSWSDQSTIDQFERTVNQGMVSAYKACIDAQKDVMLKEQGAFAYAIPQDDYLQRL